MSKIKGIVLTDTEAAYLAGLLDGEGSFHVGIHYSKSVHCATRGFNWEIRVRIGMTEPDALLVYNRIFCKQNSLRKTASKRGHRDIYSLTLYSGEIRELLPQVIPFLLIKRKQAELLLEASTLLTPRSSQERDQRIYEIRNMISLLNNPGGQLRGAAIVYQQKGGNL